MKFQEQHAAQADQFVILTFHDNLARSLAELDGKLEQVIRDVWKKPLPFPILMDSSGRTLKEWNIRAFPTVVLIDPEGNIVPGKAEELLAEKLKAGASAKGAEKE
jgi:hypothetical protein